MNNSNSKVNIDFRFLKLNKLQAYTLAREVIDFSYQKSATSDNYIGSVALTNFSIDDINDFFVRQMVDIKHCDILVSVSSNSHASTVEISTVVNRMLKYIDCKLTYSFSVIDTI